MCQASERQAAKDVSWRVHFVSVPRTGPILMPQSKQDGRGPVPSPQTLADFTVGQPWALIYLAGARIKVCECVSEDTGTGPDTPLIWEMKSCAI